MIEKMSCTAFMDAMDGKRVELMTACVVGKEMFEKALESLKDDEKYLKVMNKPIENKDVGVFHKHSTGFCRVMTDGTSSYKFFDKGSYIMSDGKLSFIINPSIMHVCVYRVID